MEQEIKITFENIEEAMVRFGTCKEKLDTCLNISVFFEESSGNVVIVLKELSTVMLDCIKEIGSFLEQIRSDLQNASKVFQETEEDIGNKMKKLP